MEYARRKPNCGFYPEALYYAGRVYSDMGDSFTALRYYQDALDKLSDNEENRNLRCRILSQTASLMNSLRLYKQAIPYLEECINLNKALGDSVNTFFNLRDLAETNLQLKDYEVPSKITSSQAYIRMRSLIKEEKNLKDYKQLWKDLDKVVCKVYPNYKEELSLLMGKRVNETIIQTCIMIKCGLSSAVMMKALDVSAGAVSDRRKKISEKIFGENVGNSIIDAIIQRV